MRKDHPPGVKLSIEARRILRNYHTTTIGVTNREAFCLALPCA
jgi:hypothetical protein